MRTNKKKETKKISKKTIKKVCIDDFAIKKRHTYATIMVNIETGKTIDMLESREIADVTEWLKTYPNIEIVSRDGSRNYAKAIKEAHPNALQITDRFHLVKNLSEYCKNILSKILKAKIEIPKETTFIENNNNNNENNYFKKSKLKTIKKVKELYEKGYNKNQISKELQMDIRTVIKYIEIKITETTAKDINEKRREERLAVKISKVERVRELYKEKYSKADIRRITGFARNTIDKYLNPDYTPENSSYRNTRKSKLSPYHDEIKELLENNYKLKDIYIIIKEKGFEGSNSTIRAFAKKERKIMNEFKKQNKNTELINRHYITKLLFKPLEKVKKLSENQLDKVFKKFPIIKEIIELVKEFKTTLKSKKVENLLQWMNKASSLNIKELNSFINGMKKDIDAVKNAVLYDYNNGLAEGKINKLKLNKRIMYGRCGFDLLRNKVLLNEY